MSGLTGDRRGATSVIVAVSMVVLLGFAAISLDVAAFLNERQRLQNGADAAALAIAVDCARGSCGGASATARRYVAANTTTSTATAALLNTPTSSGGQVTVVASATTEHWFAPVLGVDSSDPSARATARWGTPSAGRAVLPLIFGWCEWKRQTDRGGLSSTTIQIILTTKTSGTGCTNNSNLALPGGFGWLSPNAPNCNVSSRVGDWVKSDPGSSPPCSVAQLKAFLNQTVLLPLFDKEQGTGNNGQYRVMTYAAFRVTGYHFGGQWSENPPCRGNDRCIAGYFVRYVADSTTWEYSASPPAYGASVVRLTA